MPKIFTSKSQKIGELAENAAILFLMKHGYRIIERNYTKPWGEIDIVAEKSDVMHFIEVKSSTHTKYDPIENMHANKVRRLRKTIQTYGVTDETNWQFDVIVVILNMRTRLARVKVIKDIIL